MMDFLLSIYVHFAGCLCDDVDSISILHWYENHSNIGAVVSVRPWNRMHSKSLEFKSHSILLQMEIPLLHSQDRILHKESFLEEHYGGFHITQWLRVREPECIRLHYSSLDEFLSTYDGGSIQGYLATGERYRSRLTGSVRELLSLSEDIVRGLLQGTEGLLYAIDAFVGGGASWAIGVVCRRRE
eukprot:Gb_13416 [translate_table: standard]